MSCKSLGKSSGKSLVIVFALAVFPVLAQASDYVYAGPQASRLITSQLLASAQAGDQSVVMKDRGYGQRVDKNGIQCLIEHGLTKAYCALPGVIDGVTARALEDIFRSGIREGLAPINETVDASMNHVYWIDNVSCTISDVENLVGCKITKAAK